MAPRKTAASPKPDKLIRDALLIELQADSGLEERGKKLKKLRLVARALIDKGIDGDVAAIREIADRVEGKAAQGVTVSGNPDAPIQHSVQIKFVSANNDD